MRLIQVFMVCSVLIVLVLSGCKSTMEIENGTSVSNDVLDAIDASILEKEPSTNVSEILEAIDASRFESCEQIEYGQNYTINNSPRYQPSLISGFSELHPPEGTLFYPEMSHGCVSEGPYLAVRDYSCERKVSEDCIRNPEAYYVDGKIAHPVFRERQMAMLVGDHMEPFFGIITNAFVSNDNLFYVVNTEYTSKQGHITYKSTKGRPDFINGTVSKKDGQIVRRTSGLSRQSYLDFENKTYGPFTSINKIDGPNILGNSPVIYAYVQDCECWSLFHGTKKLTESPGLISVIDNIGVLFTVRNNGSYEADKVFFYTLASGLIEEYEFPDDFAESAWIYDSFLWNNKVAFIALTNPRARANEDSPSAIFVIEGSMLKKVSLTEEYNRIELLDGFVGNRIRFQPRYLVEENKKRPIPLLYGRTKNGHHLIDYPRTINNSAIIYDIKGEDFLWASNYRFTSDHRPYQKYEELPVNFSYDVILDMGYTERGIYVLYVIEDNIYLQYESLQFGPYKDPIHADVHNFLYLTKLTRESKPSFYVEKEGERIIFYEGKEIGQEYDFVLKPQLLGDKLIFMALKDNKWIFVVED